ncbi:MAG: lysophospholipid acyltransferase family protein, partial [Syntrophales bacterium]|nr:lysophospholipid acyltransferase family protein [Syntrophales bacterium]
ITGVTKMFLQLQYTLGQMAIFFLGPLYFIAIKLLRYRVRGLKELRREFALQIKKHEGPWIICANHLTMIDSMLLTYSTASLYTHLMHYRVLPWNLPERNNFQRNILLTLFCYLAKCIPVNRGGDRKEMKKTLDKCAYLLTEKQHLMIFPEGGRSRTGRVDTENFSYGVGRFIKDIAGCEVMCIYLRGDGQDNYGTIPKFGERFTAVMSVLELQKTELGGLRAQKYYAEQIIKRLAQMEEDYFALRGQRHSGLDRTRSEGEEPGHALRQPRFHSR